jgi:serine protease AprX
LLEKLVYTFLKQIKIMIKITIKTIACGFIFLMLNISFLVAQNSKIDPSVFSLMKGNRAEVFVVMKEQADLSRATLLETKEQKGEYVFQILRGVAQRSQSDIQYFLKAQKIDFQSFWIFNGIFLTADKTLITQLVKRSDVAQIVSNPSSRLSLPQLEAADLKETSLKTRGALEITWGIVKINANAVWDLGYTGKGVIVGGQDTGYDWEHPAIKKKYRGFDAQTGLVDHNYNWFDAIHPNPNTLFSPQANPCGYNSPKPCDDNSHGTHTMGTMVGRDDSIAIGVAPDAQWIAARNMDSGNGTLYSYTESFQWFLAPTDLNNRLPNPRKSPHVINNSWYCSTGEGCNATNFAILEAAMNACRAAGIVVVVSAGNAGPACSTVNQGPPAFFSKAFSIGATQSNDTIAGFSSRGPVTIDGSNRLKPNVSAPGVGVKSAIPNKGYANFNGTSMAGPHVAGAVALMISANPKLAGQVDSIERILERTSKPLISAQNCGSILGTSIPNNTYGFGRIDALEAVKQAIAFKPMLRGGSMSSSQTALVSPNPIGSEINVFTEGFEGETQVEIVNVRGQVVVSRKEIFNFRNNIVIQLPNLASGIYFYRIQNETQRLVGKLVKM